MSGWCSTPTWSAGCARGPSARLARRRWGRRLWWGITPALVGVGLAAWWLVPFAAGQAYTTNMGCTNVDGFPHLLFPASARWVLVADLVGVVAMVVRRNRVALFIGIMGGFSAAVVCLDPEGKLYNVRFLPFWFLCIYLLAGYALAEVVSAVARWNRRRRLDQWVVVIRERLKPVQGMSWQPGMRISRFRRPVPAGNPPGAVIGPHRGPGRRLSGGGAAPGPSGHRRSAPSASPSMPTSPAPGPSGTTRATSRSPTTPSTRRSST